MAKRCLEEFNPWLAFVDIFSSVILVMLLYLLITIVNVAYYSQYKFKVSYSGTIATEELITKEDEDKNKNELDIDEVKPEEPIQIINKKINIKENAGDFESAGKDLRKFYEDEATKQTTVANNNYLIVNFGDNGIKIDNASIIKIKEFINKTKQKFPKHIVKISASDPTNQISSTVKRQISLARTINSRNLIRQLNYPIRDVRIDLMKSSKMKIDNDNPYGYLIIRIEKK